jgi:hypothetical protein
MKRQTLLLALVIGMSLLGAREAVCKKPPQSPMSRPKLDRSSVSRNSDNSRSSQWDSLTVTLSQKQHPGEPQSIVEGRLLIKGTQWRDNVEIRSFESSGSGSESMQFIEIVQYDNSIFKRVASRNIFYADDVERIVFMGYDGDDHLLTNFAPGVARPIQAQGGNGNDYLQGGPLKDLLIGGSGDDDLYGQAGNDYLRGGSGDDDLYGGDGDDTLTGGNGKDCLYGGADNDRLIGDKFVWSHEHLGGYTADVHSETGDHTLADTCVGGPGEDEFVMFYYTYVYTSSGEGVVAEQYDNYPDFRPEEGDWENRVDILVLLP